MSKKQAILETEGKESIKSQTDCFSKLPDDILPSIASHFSVNDAANVSLVSKRWRYLCASRSRLEFDWASMFRTHKDCGSGCDDEDGHPCQRYRDRFVRGVDQFLQFYKEGSQLVFFRVCLCLDRDSTSDIDRWVSFAVSKGVIRLNLDLLCTRKSSSKHRTPYILRPELLSPPNNVPKICFLLLRCCVLGPGVIDHFSSIISLTLVQMAVGQGDVERILSCCLNLNSFLLKKCKLPPKLCISSSLQRLKVFAVMRCHRLRQLVLSATYLKSFEYVGTMITFNFSRVRNLERIYFRAREGEGLRYVFSQLAKDLPRLKALSVHTDTKRVKLLRLPQEIATFSNLKLLELLCDQSVALDLDIGRLIVFLRAFPLLEKLYLVVKCRVNFLLKTDVAIEFVNKDLKEVHIGGFRNTSSFIHLALYFLKYATGLEKMVIDRRTYFYISNGRWECYNEAWDVGDRHNICERLQGRFKSEVVILP